MEIYIEYVIIDNLIIDSIIILFSAFTIKTTIKKINIFLSACFGTFCAVILPLITLNFYILLGIKFAIGVFMVLLLKKYKNFREFLIMILIFYTYTFVFGGMCFGITCALNIKSSGGGILINGYDIPMGLFVSLISVYVYFMTKLISYIRNRNLYSNLYCDVVLVIDGKSHYIRGYIDSGNKLYDSLSNMPVIIVSFSTFCTLFSTFPYQKLLLQKSDNLGLKNSHYITVEGVNSSEQMLVFNVDEIRIKQGKNQRIKNALIGVSKKIFSSDFECLLHSDFIKEEFA